MFSKSGQIRLRSPEPSDARVIYQWENDPQLWRAGDTLVPYSMFQIEEFILNSSDLYGNKQLRFMIEKQTNNKFMVIGMLDMYDFDPHNSRAGVGLMIVKEARGKGFASEAIETFEQYAFITLNLHQLFCFINSDNKSSLALFTKLGYLQTGLRKHWIRVHTSWIDQIQLQHINPNHQLISQ